MDNYYIVWLLLFFAVILPLIAQRSRAAAIKHILNRKKHDKERITMKELANRFVGKDCIVYTIAGTDSTVKGTIKEVSDSGIIIEKPDGIEAVNLEYVTRIREWPRNAKGKKKQIF